MVAGITRRCRIRKRLYGRSGLKLDLECSSWPDGWWNGCCVQHDYDYADGVNKWKADWRLAKCVAKKGAVVDAVLMWAGLTVFGWKAYNKHKEARNARKR